MTRPDDIPAYLWEAAAEPATVVFDASVDLYETGTSAVDVQSVIARAMMAVQLAERERAAQIAERFSTVTSPNYPLSEKQGQALEFIANNRAKVIAAAIRNHRAAPRNAE